MRFVFCDKSETELDIITDILSTENIPYQTEPKVVKHYYFCDDEDEDDDDFVFIEKLYNIHCFTDLAHFDFVKAIAYKKIAERIKLERCYLKKVSKKNVQRVHKKGITNTNNRNKSK